MALVRVPLVLICLFLALVHPARTDSEVARLAWLEGCWEATSQGRIIEEHWMAPRGRSMIGVSRTIRGDTLAEFELVVLRERGDRLAYEAHPRGQPSAVFLATALTDSSAVFENRAHDFPQRVGYRRVGHDSLLAWIEGSLSGKRRRIDYPYRRVPCGSP